MVEILMKVTIDITPKELERIKNLLWKRAALVKVGFDSKTIEDVILHRIYEAAQKNQDEDSH